MLAHNLEDNLNNLRLAPLDYHTYLDKLYLFDYLIAMAEFCPICVEYQHVQPRLYRGTNHCDGPHQPRGSHRSIVLDCRNALSAAVGTLSWLKAGSPGPRVPAAQPDFDPPAENKAT